MAIAVDSSLNRLSSAAATSAAERFETSQPSIYQQLRPVDCSIAAPGSIVLVNHLVLFCNSSVGAV